MFLICGCVEVVELYVQVAELSNPPLAQCVEILVLEVTFPIDSKKTVPITGGIPKQVIFSQVKVEPLKSCKHLNPLGNETYTINPSSEAVTGI